MKNKATQGKAGRNTRRLALTGAILVVLGLGVGAWRAAQSKPETPPAKARSAPNRLDLPAEAAQLAFLRVEEASGAALPATDPMNARLALAEDRTARIFPPLAGRVINLVAELGDSVVAGKPLLTLDAPDYGQAIADLRKAEADHGLKKKALARAQLLFDGEALARRDLEAAQADAQMSAAEAERAKLRLANLVPQGGAGEGQRLVLRAPLSGVVVERQANPGTEVRPDTPAPLFVISDLRRLWLQIDLPEKSLARAKPGETVHFRVDAYPEADFVAQVERVGSSVDPATRRVPVRAVVDNRDGRLKAEMFARATLDADTRTVVRVPVGALLTQGLNTQLFLAVGPGSFERRAVSVLRQDSEFAYLSAESPIKAGDKVVVRGALLLASELAQGE